MKSLTVLAVVVTCIAAVSLHLEFNQETIEQYRHASEVESNDAVIAPVVAVGNRDISAFLDRPIFSETRSPLKQPRVSSDQQVVAQVEQLSGQYRLAGVVLTTEQQFAVMHDQKADKTLTLALSESVAGWQLKQLEPAMATFDKDGEQRQLVLMKDISPGKELVVNDDPVIPAVVVMESQNDVLDEDPYQ